MRAAVINFTENSDWTKVGDYYYYNYKLAPSETTDSLIESVTFNALTKLGDTCIPSTTNGTTTITCNSSGSDYDNATYKLTINIETVQYNKYQEAWNTSVAIASKRQLIIKGLKINNSDATYETGDKHQMFEFEHSVTDQTPALKDYRYIGNDPYNYVYFNCDTDGANCEIWRIIGIFSVERTDSDDNIVTEQRIKIVRSTDFTGTMQWHESVSNDWLTSYLKTYLNVDYYSDLKLSAKSQVDSSIFYLGGGAYDSELHYGSTEGIYAWERGNIVYNGRVKNWEGKIGLMYPTDLYMTYAKGVDDTCYNDPYLCENGIPSSSWIYNTNVLQDTSEPTYTWFLSPGSAYMSDVYDMYPSGHFTGNISVSKRGVRPALYLKANIEILAGTGEESNPYSLSNNLEADIENNKIDSSKPAAQELINNAIDENYNENNKNELFAINHNDITDYRFIGDNPYNYVYFNCDDLNNPIASTCEKWRILGVFDVERSDPQDSTRTISEKRIKLVRGTPLDTTMHWHSTDANDWTISSLKTFLNNSYLNRAGDSANIGLKKYARDLIDDAKYYLGSVSYDSTNKYGTVEKVYGEERGNVLCKACNNDVSKLEWQGKVGIMYPSDIYLGFSNGVNDSCYSNPAGCSNSNTSWISNSNALSGTSGSNATWLISPYANSNQYSMMGYQLGILSFNKTYSSDPHSVRPVVYLKSDVRIIYGDGSETNPYVLAGSN